ncbi:hypothetical protein, partial [Salmonella enterica]|uniref:hypothetical protein n=1 Tax=Salmonella enterica TaxID=28901 RepID=UPI0020C1D0E4
KKPFIITNTNAPPPGPAPFKKKHTTPKISLLCKKNTKKTNTTTNEKEKGKTKKTKKKKKEKKEKKTKKRNLNHEKNPR